MDHPGQTKEEEDLPPPGHRRGKKRVVVKSKTAAKMANFKTVCSYFRDQLNNLINMLMSTSPPSSAALCPTTTRSQESSTPSWSCTNLLAMECLRESEFVGRAILTESYTMTF